MGRFLIGTSGYYYPDWVGSFYPEGLNKKDFLSYYATQFDAVEINNTFYRMPSKKNVASMISKTDAKLSFSLKVTKTLTHELTPSWIEEASNFKRAIEPLLVDGVLTSILFQFPYSFHYTKDNRIYLSQLLKQFEGYPSVVEFRESNWQKDSVYEGLKNLDSSICLVDMPSIKNLPVFLPIITNNQAYIRFHGRNSHSWYAGDAKNNGSARYRYLYSREELKETVGTIKILKDRAQLTQIFFNNHPEGAAAFNARMLKSMFG